jgi:hypothetical protein
MSRFFIILVKSSIKISREICSNRKEYFITVWRTNQSRVISKTTDHNLRPHNLFIYIKCSSKLSKEIGSNERGQSLLQLEELNEARIKSKACNWYHNLRSQLLIIFVKTLIKISREIYFNGRW